MAEERTLESVATIVSFWLQADIPHKAGLVSYGLPLASAAKMQRARVCSAR